MVVELRFEKRVSSPSIDCCRGVGIIEGGRIGDESLDVDIDNGTLNGEC